MTMSKSDSGKLGALASREISTKKKLIRIEEYNINPNYCTHCSKALPYEKRHSKFCDHTCSATHNNLKRGITTVKCLFCSNEMVGKHRKFCDSLCQKEFEYFKTINDWNNKSPGKAAMKRYLSETFGYSCSVCGISEWNDKRIVLELEHKDGNSENNTKDNLCLICPNCHSQTETYKGKNKGNGRHYRRQRYKEGKSF